MHQTSIHQLAKIMNLRYIENGDYQRDFDNYGFDFLENFQTSGVFINMLKGQLDGIKLHSFELVPTQDDIKPCTCIILENPSWELPDVVLDPKQSPTPGSKILPEDVVEDELEPQSVSHLILDDPLEIDNDEISEIFYVVGRNSDEVNAFIQKIAKPLLKNPRYLECKNDRILLYKSKLSQSLDLEQYINDCVAFAKKI